MTKLILNSHRGVSSNLGGSSWNTLILQTRSRGVRMNEFYSWDRLNEIKDSVSILNISCQEEDDVCNDFPESLLEYGQLFALRIDTKLSSLPFWFGNMHQLRDLDISSNRLTVLPECIGGLVNLSMLDFGWNQITELPEWIGNLRNLKALLFEDNQIQQLPESFSSLQQLKELCFEGNRFTSFPENIRGIQTLQFIDCRGNQITSIPEWIQEFTRLDSFDCAQNMITTLPIQFIMCRSLLFLRYEGNPIEYIPQPLLRRIENLRNHRAHRNFYGDNQNVHDTSIQESIKNSIFTLLNDTGDISEEDLKKNILENEAINESTKNALIEYMENTETHSILNISFGDLLQKVIPRIDSHPTSKLDLYQRLNEEMGDAECMCFTGRLTRLVNVLAGFYDDIKIEISANTQISVIIALVKERHHLTDEDDLTEEAKTEIRQELQERGYDSDTIEPWLSV